MANYLNEVIQHELGDPAASPVRVRQQERDVGFRVTQNWGYEREADYEFPGQKKKSLKSRTYLNFCTSPS